MRKNEGRGKAKMAAAARELAAERERIVKMLPVPGEPATERYTADEWAPLVHDEFVLSALDRIEVERLRQVEEAIARVRDGTYGRCTECGEAIPERRLAALPWAERCVGCAEGVFAKAA